MNKKKTILILLITLFISQLFAQSLNFDGVDDFVEIPNSSELIQDKITIEAWIRQGKTGTLQPIVSKYNTNMNQNSYSIVITEEDKILFGVYESFSPDRYRVIETNNRVAETDIWQHVAGTFDISTQELNIYINGVPVPCTLLSGSSTINSIYQSTIPLLIGNSIIRDGTSFHFNGNIDEVRLWSKARTMNEIQGAFKNELTGKEDNLVAYYSMNVPYTICDVLDCNENENHGTRKGIAGTNNTPQYSDDTPELIKKACEVNVNCFSTSNSNLFADVEAIEIYPNPFKKSITLEFDKSLAKRKIEQIRIVSMNGEIIYQNRTINLYSNRIMIDVNTLMIGLYFMEIKTLDKTIIKKIFKID